MAAVLTHHDGDVDKAEQTKDTAGTAEAVDKQKQDVATEEKTADAALETAEAESKEK
jgi:hypothetical protein